jgi:predicted TPR repeat methyltransferase
MPHSLRENDEVVVDFARWKRVETVLDVGVGCGTYAHLLAPIGCTLDAIEVWRPYVQEYDLESLYRAVYVGDVRDMAKSNDWNHSYDLIIFGDVLEHMTMAEALAVWGWAAEVATWGMISVPTVHWPQAGTENPYEEHVQEHIDVTELTRVFGPFDEIHRFAQTATFIRRFRG